MSHYTAHHPRVVLLGLLAVTGSLGQVIPGRYIVELTGEPAASYALKQADRRKAAMDRRQAIAVEQQRARLALSSAGVRVFGSADTVANALFVQIPAGRVAEIEKTPGVLRVHQVRRVHALLNRVLPIQHVPEAWSRIGGVNLAGKGMKIAILDTGIDQTNPGFNADLTVPEGFPRVSSDKNQQFVNKKVIVARSYEAMSNADYGEDAGDHVGHGTNAGFAAAGVPVELSGGRITGIISGVAPAAFLGNYKVLGNNGGGSTDVIIKGIDDAVKDEMDVINMSLGSDLAANPETDIQVRAVELAVAAGAVVVVAAGNAGPDENTINSPGTAPSAITVGSSSSDRSADTDPIAPLDPNRMSGFSSRGPNFGNGLKPDVLAVGDNFITADSSLKPGAGSVTVTQGTSFATPVVSGAAALLKAARPGIGVLAYRSLLINSASKLVYSNGQPAPIRFAGSGRLDMDAALQSTLAVAPTALKFGSGSASPDVSRELILANAGQAAATFTLSIDRYPSGAAAPTLSAASVTIQPGSTASVTVRFAGQGLAPGEYQGRIVVRASNSPVESGIPYWYAVASDTPTKISILETPGADNPGAQKTFGIRLLDNSGLPFDLPVTVTPVCGGQVNEVVGNDPSVPGLTAASVTLGAAAGSSVFRIDAGGVRRYLTVDVKGNTDTSVSYVPACGITNGASFVPGEVAPGSFSSIFGNRLASGLVQNTQVPLATQLGGTTVAINGIPAPLFFVSPSQINFQVPYEVSSGPAEVTVTVGGAPLTAVPFTVSPTSPGVLQFGAGRAVAVNLDGSVNDAGNPAPVGSAVVVYGTGLGPIDNPVPSGSPAPASGIPLSRAASEVKVTLGGIAVPPLFAGLTPGFVGLMQVNLVIPQLPTGTYPLVITVGGAPSKPVQLTVR